eukprot:Nk52_evm34s628 gene=Nk52_evmTU34s628
MTVSAAAAAVSGGGGAGLAAEKLFSRVMASTYARPAILFTHGKGSRLWDSSGKEYVDFCSGIAVTTLGHADPAFNAAVQTQLGKLTHVSNLYHTQPSLDLAAALVERASFADKVFFCNSGTEANEGAIKFARLFGGTESAYSSSRPLRRGIVCFENGFHGRTMGSLSVTPNPAYQTPFGPLLGAVRTAEFNNVASAEEAILSGPKKTKSSVGNESADSDNDGGVCAVVLEVIQGEGGINEASLEFAERVQSLCEEQNCLLIVDEVQTGFGRTGKLFAHEHYNLKPDIVTLAKPMANGLPIGCILMSERVASLLKPGLHGSTFAGNPLVTAASLHVLDRIEKEHLMDNVVFQSKRIVQRLASMKGIKKVKGRGLLLGIETNFENSKVVQEALDKGLLLVGAGGNTVRLLPPINVSDEDVDLAMDILHESLENVSIDQQPSAEVH